MSREVSKDFEEFITFLKNYKLKKVFKNDEVIKNLRKIHKKYYSYLTLISELESLVDDTKLKPEIKKIQFTYIVESSSDILSAVFHSINGSYKSARMMLRSSIETFFKGFCEQDIEGILEEKRIFVIFDSIKEIDYFKKEPQKTMLNSCLSEYGDLCKDTHTAKAINMQKLTAFKYFPSYDDNQMNDISKRILKLIQVYLFLICNRHNSHFQQMHHRNKANIILSIKKSLKPIILNNIDYKG
ncbi:hypothetical protein [Flavivirga spongiicola]|uniref:Uncharacterized protein n=1 Tax=Flavivirga spongiicola TaxID=421621 RepID=A0ABU7XTN3_9FLAO|nr:hypothetical protein [Flavivirga sp. MEBiC05379]MDO5978794.1 hypothetical protein [Flavivirga sp. MEBiC05379]